MGDKNQKKVKKVLNNKKPDFYVKIVLSSYEAALIRKLRKFEWGDFVVLKQFGEPRKCDAQESSFLDESDGMALEIESREMESKLLKEGATIIDQTNGG